MLMAAPPIYNCYEAILEKRKELTGKRKVVYMSPAGKILNQTIADNLAKCEHVIVLCGHYEGVDRRILDEIGRAHV